MNAYLTALRSRYDGLRTSIEGLQTRAAEANRDLSETELTSVRAQSEQAAGLATQITELTEIENRNASAAALAARIDSDVETAAVSTRSDATITAGGCGGATTQDRDPGRCIRASSNGALASPAPRIYAARIDAATALPVVDIDNLMTATGLAVAVDPAGDGGFATTVTSYALGPVNAAADGMPWTSPAAGKGATAGLPLTPS